MMIKEKDRNCNDKYKALEIILATATFIVLSVGTYFAVKIGNVQNEINQRQLDLNSRILVDFTYDQNAGLLRLFNYGENIIHIDSARITSLPLVKYSIPIQDTIFPNKSIDIKIKDNLTFFLKGYSGDSYSGLYLLSLKHSIPNHDQYYIGIVPIYSNLIEGKMKYEIKSNNINLSKYDGNFYDFMTDKNL